MSDEHISVAPARLVEGEDNLARLIAKHKAISASAQAPRSKLPYAELMKEHRRRAHARSRTALLAAASLVGAVGISHQLITGNISTLSSAPRIAKEHDFIAAPTAATPLPGRANKEALLPSGANQLAAETTHETAPTPIEPQPNRSLSAQRFASSDRAKSPLTARSIPKRTRGSTANDSDISAVTGSGTTAETKPPLNRNCGAVQTKAGYSAALQCYAEQSAGSGIRAELSYLERARLEQRHGDLEAALQSITAYKQRFPQGTLHPEATLGRIRLLVQMGRGHEARTAITQATAQLPEKAASLKELAVDLAVAEGNCKEARDVVRGIAAEIATPRWKSQHLRACLISQP